MSFGSVKIISQIGRQNKFQMFILFSGRPIACVTLIVEKPPKVEEQGNGRLLTVNGVEAGPHDPIQFVAALILYICHSLIGLTTFLFLRV